MALGNEVGGGSLHLSCSPPRKPRAAFLSNSRPRPWPGPLSHTLWGGGPPCGEGLQRCRWAARVRTAAPCAKGSDCPGLAWVVGFGGGKQAWPQDFLALTERSVRPGSTYRSGPTWHSEVSPAPPPRRSYLPSLGAPSCEFFPPTFPHLNLALSRPIPWGRAPYPERTT